MAEQWSEDLAVYVVETEKDFLGKGRGGEQYILRFPNGRGVSVIRHDYSYGGKDGKWELAVLSWEGGGRHLDYTTPITDDVLGWLTWADVERYTRMVLALPEEGSGG